MSIFLLPGTTCLAGTMGGRDGVSLRTQGFSLRKQETFQQVDMIYETTTIALSSLLISHWKDLDS